jgi:putative ABC transport system permease protein
MNAREIVGRIQALFRRDALDRQLAEDIESHLELLARDFAGGGLSVDEARAAARRQIGNVTHLREESRDAWGFPAVEAVLQDLRYAARGLKRAPGFTITVVVTLALGIGTNAAMFGVVDRLMFRPFPYMRDPSSVHRVYLQTTYQGKTTTSATFPYLRFLDLSRATPAVDAIAAESEWRFGVGEGAGSRVRIVSGVSAAFFSFFDAVPVRGRFFTEDENRTPVGAPVAVISSAMWASEFQSSDVLGRTLKVGTIPYTIIGVAPPGFRGTVEGGQPDVFVPITTIPSNLNASSQASYLADYRWDWTSVLVRGRRGVPGNALSRELTSAYVQSRAAARAINPRVLPDSIAHPLAIAGPVKSAAGPSPGLEARVLLWVFGVAAIVLLIACANVANLMLVRVLRRRREITVRLALGIRRGRLATQLATEGLLLALLGGVSGVLVAQWLGVAIRRLLMPEGSPFNLVSDWRTLGVALACACGATVLTSLGPVALATRTDLASTLKAGARSTYHRSRLHAVLLGIQSALSVVLLVGAGLFVRSLDNVLAVPLGYDARPVLEAVVDFRGHAMDGAQTAAANRRLLSVAQSLPGVLYATRVNSHLFATNTADLRVPGIDSVSSLGRFNFQMASPDYFKVMQTRVLRGRAFTEADRRGTPLVAVVSEAMGRALWPGRDPLGQCIRVGIGDHFDMASMPCTTVIGIAENAAQQTLGDDPRFMYYLPFDQVSPGEGSTILLRLSTDDAASRVEEVRRDLTRMMPGDGLVVVRPLQELVDGHMRSWRLGATLFVAFGGLALLVAVVGLYGVISYQVTQRIQELGVRIALGARAADVVQLVVWQGTRVAAAAVAVGLGLAFFTARWVQPLLFHQSATDPTTYALVATTVLLAAMVASAVPAVRGARTDPCAALRSE